MREANVVPLDLGDFQRRAHAIAKARQEARMEVEEEGIKEAEAEHQYRKVKAIRWAKHSSDGMTQKQAEAQAEHDAADYKLQRDTAHMLKRSAEMRWQELERNAASLRVEANLSEAAA